MPATAWERPDWRRLGLAGRGVAPGWGTGGREGAQSQPGAGQEPAPRVLILICHGRKCGPCSQPSWAPWGGPRPSGCSSQHLPTHPCLLPVRPTFLGWRCWEAVAAPGHDSGLGGLWVGWHRKCCTLVLFTGTTLRFPPLLWRRGRLGAGGSGGSMGACGGGPVVGGLCPPTFT